MPLALAPLAVLPNYGSAHAYPTFELSNTVQLLAKTASREQKLGPCPETPYCPETPSVTLPSYIFNPERQFNSLPDDTNIPGRWLKLILHTSGSLIPTSF